MTKRPFIQKGIEELEALFDERRDDGRFLQTLIAELGERKTQRARDLKARAVSAAGTARSSRPVRTPEPVVATPVVTLAPSASATASTFGRRPTDPQPPQTETDMPPLTVQQAPPPPKIENKPDAILSAWTAMEVLSPPSFRRPEDLAGGDGASLPWENGGEKSRPNQRLYYQIILGSVDMEAVIGSLLRVYTDSRAGKGAVVG